MTTPVATLTVGDALKELREMFPSEFFRITINEVAEIDEHGNVRWRERYASIMRLDEGLDGFYTAATLDEALTKICRHAEQKEKTT